MKPQGVFLFYTTSAALRAEKVLLAARLPVKLIPTPRQFSSDCGVALRFDWDQHAKAEGFLREAKVETAGLRALT
jgi:hypothetical protein